MTPIEIDINRLLSGQKARIFASPKPSHKTLVDSALDFASQASLFTLHFSSGNPLKALPEKFGLSEAIISAIAASAPVSQGIPDFARHGNSPYGLAWATAYYLRRTKMRGLIIYDPHFESSNLGMGCLSVPATLAILQILHRESNHQVSVAVMGPLAYKYVDSFPDLEVTRHPDPLGSLPPAQSDERATEPPPV